MVASKSAGLVETQPVQNSHDAIVEVREEDAYRQRFAPFAELYERVKGEPYPLER